MSSLWNRSGTVERFADDLRAPGAQAFFFQGGTTSPLTVYRDSGQGSAHPSPVLTDANGRWPDVFVPYVVSFDVQVKSAAGQQLTYTLQIPNPNPQDASNTAPPVVEPVTTGMIHAEMINGTKTNYVRLNGRTIGTSGSGATERANGANNTNSDVFNLYSYLYNGLSNAVAPVSGGRTTLVADFNANKTLTLPDWRGVGPVGLDDMGNSAAGAFTGLTFSVGSAITAGSTTGTNGVTLTLANTPPHSHTGGTTSTDGDHTHAIVGTVSGTTSGGSAHTHTFSGNTGLVGGGLPHFHTVPISQVVQVGGGAPNSASANSGTTNTSTVDLNHLHAFSGTTDPESSHTHTFSASISSGLAQTAGAHNHTFSTSVVGGSGGVAVPFNNLGSSRTVTWFIKL